MVATGLLTLSPETTSGAATLAHHAVSNDPYENPSSYHRTEGEPHVFAVGSTIVSAFMVAYHLAPPGGAANIGWSVSTDAGQSWDDHFLPGTSLWATPPGPWFKMADPAVAYDAKHDTWLIVGLGAPRPASGAPFQNRVFVSRSTDDGATFGEPVIVKAPNESQFFDKTWISCDNTPTSDWYGHCYVEWDDEGHHLRLNMSTSTDGGMSWAKADVRKDTWVINGHPLSQPNGEVIMPIDQCCPTRIDAFTSVDGGLSYSGHGTDYSGPQMIPDVKMSPISGLAVNIEPPAISAAVDASGKVFVVWADCRSRPDCSQNDLFLSTTLDGRHWSAPSRIPLGGPNSSKDRFLPTIAVDPSTAGTSAHVAIAYYYYPQAECTVETCELRVGFVSSTDGGSTWNSRSVAGPFGDDWLPPGPNGFRFADYIGATFVDGTAIVVYVAASEGTCVLGDLSCHTWIGSVSIPVAS
jgi:hypothetical protein